MPSIWNTRARKEKVLALAKLEKRLDEMMAVINRLERQQDHLYDVMVRLRTAIEPPSSTSQPPPPLPPPPPAAASTSETLQIDEEELHDTITEYAVAVTVEREDQGEEIQDQEQKPTIRTIKKDRRTGSENNTDPMPKFATSMNTIEFEEYSHIFNKEANNRRRAGQIFGRVASFTAEKPKKKPGKCGCLC